MLIASTLFGTIVQKIGWYTPVGIVGCIIMTIGAGLFTTFQVDTSAGKWIGYQILFGFGMGFAMQTPSLAFRTVLPKKDVPVGMALGFFFQLLGGAISVPIGTNVFNTQLLKRLSSFPGFDPSLVTSGGITGLINALPEDLKPEVLIAYNGAIQEVFKIGLILSALGFIGTAGLEWKNVLTASGDGTGPAKKKEEKAPEAAKTGSDGEIV